MYFFYEEGIIILVSRMKKLRLRDLVKVEVV